MRNQRGQGLVEYLILVCLIAVSAIAVVTAVGTNIKEQYANVSAGLRHGRKINLTPIDASAYQKRNMDDFNEDGKK